MTESTLTQFVLAYLGTVLVEWMKRATGLPFMTASTDKINKVVGAVIAFLATVGIGWATSWDAASGTFTLTLTGITVTGIFGFLWHWFTQFVLQQAAYHGIVKSKEKA